MTHSGGKPHEVGERGQRYEISFFDPDANERRVLGWTDSSEQAQRMASGIEVHPRWQFPQIADRDIDRRIENLRADLADPDCTGWTCPQCSRHSHKVGTLECPECGFDAAPFQPSK